MMNIPDYIIFEDIRKREETRDGGLIPLPLPLYAPEILERSEPRHDEDEAPARGVIIIDMDSLDEVIED